MTADEKRDYLLIVGGRIKELRKKRGLSQEELSKLCEYNSRSTINKIEMGINDIPLSKIQKIADVLNVSPVVLLGIDAPPPHQDTTLTDTEQNVIDKYRTSDDLTKGMVHRILGVEEEEAKKENFAG